MKKYSLFFVMILMVFSGFSLLHSQEGRGVGRVAGYVTDQEGNPVDGVKILLESLKYEFSMETTSDGKGKWGFYGFANGPYRIIAEKEGYVRHVMPIQLSQAGKNPKQRIELEKASETPVVAIKDDGSRSEFLQGNQLFKQEDFKGALDMFLKFREKNPLLYKVGINVGNCYFKLRKYPEAIEEYKKVLTGLEAEAEQTKEISTTTARVYASLGEAFMAQDKFAEAEANFKKSMEIDPTDHALAYNVAEILFNMNKVDEAVKYYETAIKIKPDWPKSYLKIGYAYLNKGDTAKAVSYMEKFVELAPNDPQADTIKSLIKDLK